MPTGSISTYERGMDLVVEWRIHHFSTLDESDGARYYSDFFSFGFERWWLVIWPNGCSEQDSFGHVVLFLYKYHSGSSIKVPFSLSLKTAEGEKYNEELLTKDFRDGDNFHMFNRFISRAELSERRSDLVPGDVLTIVCTMKRSSSAGSDSNSGSAEMCSFDSESVKCCHKCLNCSAIVKKQKTLLEELESQKKRSEDYKKMLSDGRHHDLILKVGDKELRAHRDVLRVRSRVFESMLDHDMKEGNTGIIDVPDCDPDAMELFLSYVYCGKIEALDHSNMLGFYYIADKYEMLELKIECCNFIKEALSHTNICSVIQLALNHSDSELLEYTTGYFAENMVEIMQTVEWQSFHKANFTVGYEIIIKSVKKLKNAQT